MIISLENKTLKIVDGPKTYILRERDLVVISKRTDYISLTVSQGGTPPLFRIYRGDVTSPASTSFDDLYSTILTWFNIVKNERSLDGLCEILANLTAIQQAYPKGELDQIVGNRATGTIHKWSANTWTDTGISYIPTVDNILTTEWYGVERDRTIASPDWTRIGGNMSLHVTLPVQSLLKGAILKTDKTVNYYLHPLDWTKKGDGTASNLTGVDGNVVVRKNGAAYWKHETAGNIERIKCSLYPLPGFFKIDTGNIGAYKAQLVTTKLSSVKGVLPTTSRSETQFRIDARNNGAGYNLLYSEPKNELLWMIIVEYATNNFQKPVDATLTAEGYKKGGLGDGVTTAIYAEWAAFNGANPFITTGVTDSLANGSGEVPVVIPNFGGAGVNRTFNVCRYRGIEGIYGEIYEWIDGVSFNHLADKREVWIFDDPNLIADNTSTGARFAGYLPLTDGYIKTLLFGVKGDMIPASVGGDSTTYFCDYLYTPAIGSGWKALLGSSVASLGGVSGGFVAAANNVSATTDASFGARLFVR